jgi:RNA polymerase sigma-70 factor (ECF subfamily)
VYLLQDQDDAAAVRRCLSGETAAFEVVVARHQAVLYGVAARMLGNREDAKDATQNAFVRAFERLDSYDPAFRFFSWIYRILVNECLNVLRARRPQEPLRPATRVGEGPQAGLEAEERRHRVRAALRALPEHHRDVIVLRHFADLSYEEMAATLGIPARTVKSRLFTARQQLGAALLGWKAT